MILWTLLTPEATACGYWSMKDLERGVTITFYASTVTERTEKGSATVMRLGEDLTPEAREWQRNRDGERVPPPVRWEWKVDVGDPLSMDGTVMVRRTSTPPGSEPVGEWLGADRLRLGESEYQFALTPLPGGPPQDEQPSMQLVVERDGAQVLEGVAMSLCLEPIAIDDQEREMRTRAAYWLAQSRKPGPIVPKARVEARPLSSPARRQDGVTVTASTELVSGDQTYGASSLTDDDRSTAWCEGAPNHGIGATVTLDLAEPTDPVLLLVPGYTKDRLRLTGNGQPRRLLATTNTGVVTEISVPYARDPQAAELAIPLHAPETTRIELELVEAWPGERWTDTCISELGLLSAQ